MNKPELTDQDKERLDTRLTHVLDIGIKNGFMLSIYKCVCGVEKIYRRSNVRNGNTKSCGCLNDEKRKSIEHGQARKNNWSSEYRSWLSMKARCSNPRNNEYHRYGKRGISVCERWLDFKNFIEDMGLKPGSSYSIDRINSKGNYEPGNCRWASAKEQALNSSRCKFLEFNGSRLNIADWARKTGIKHTTISFRLRSGWSIERTLLTPTLGR